MNTGARPFLTYHILSLDQSLLESVGYANEGGQSLTFRVLGDFLDFLILAALHQALFHTANSFLMLPAGPPPLVDRRTTP